MPRILTLLLSLGLLSACATKGQASVSADGSSDALFETDASAFTAIAELGGAWRLSPTLLDRPQPQLPTFMPYRYDEARAVFLHKNEHGDLNRIVLSDLGCWQEDREQALRVIVRISGAPPEALRILNFAAAIVFDHDVKIQTVQVASHRQIVFQRSNRNSRCGIEIVRTVTTPIF